MVPAAGEPKVTKRSGSGRDSDPAAPGRFFDFGMTFVEPLTPVRSSTAVVVVDMQLSNVLPDHGVNRALEAVEPGSAEHLCRRARTVVLPALQRLLSAARARGVTVAYLTLGAQHRDLRDMNPRTRAFVRNLESASGVTDVLWAGDPGYAVCPEIAPEPGDVIVPKTAWGGFNSSNLDEELRRRQLETLLVCGVTTNACVETTARDAADRGYGVALIDEACADFDEEAHEATLRAFHFNFGPVLPTVEDALVRLDATIG